MVAGASRNFVTLSPSPEQASWTSSVMKVSNAYLAKKGRDVYKPLRKVKTRCKAMIDQTAKTRKATNEINKNRE